MYFWPVAQQIVHYKKSPQNHMKYIIITLTAGAASLSRFVIITLWTSAFFSLCQLVHVTLLIANTITLASGLT